MNIYRKSKSGPGVEKFVVSPGDAASHEFACALLHALMPTNSRRG